LREPTPAFSAQPPGPLRYYLPNQLPSPVSRLPAWRLSVLARIHPRFLRATPALYGFAGFFIINTASILGAETTMLQGTAIM